MIVISIVSQKGGVGKTTIAGHLAVEACKAKNKVIIIDTDPQGSLASWWNCREKENPLFMQADINNLQIQLVEMQKNGVDLVFIDTPPAITQSIKKVISISDLILVPVRPSPHDLRAIASTVELIEDSNKPMIFIVNGATPRANITSQAAIALSQHGRVAPIILHHRIDYASSMTDGRTVYEIKDNAKSSIEITQLWGFINTILKKQVK